MSKHIVLAILVKQKEKTLPITLRSIEELDYPKENISLYVRTNNNTDNTKVILDEWLDKNRTLYRNVYYDDSDVEQEVQKYDVHEWNAERFSVLGKIRQDSLNYTLEIKADYYFVMDVDNAVIPKTLTELIKLDLPIVAPLVTNCKGATMYANYFHSVDSNGYYVSDSYYPHIVCRKMLGIFKVPVVHCTYLVRADVIPHLKYDDGSHRYEFAIFCDSARKAGIDQYIDNREQYGFLVLDEDHMALNSKMYPSISNTFTSIIDSDKWNGGCGPGSRASATVEYRQFIQRYIKENNIKSVLDFGCGDWEFSQLIDWTGVSYLGLDVVKKFIDNNNKEYSSENVKFQHYNGDDELPCTVDLIICKDVLQHLNIDLVNKLLDRFSRSSSRMLITNDISNTGNNKDIENGGWTPIKLDEAPYARNAFPVFNYSVPGCTVKKSVYLIYGEIN